LDLPGFVIVLERIRSRIKITLASPITAAKEARPPVYRDLDEGFE
jgi:hypothetical protein